MTYRIYNPKEFAKAVHRNLVKGGHKKFELETTSGAVISAERDCFDYVFLETSGYCWGAQDLRMLAKALKKLADRMDPPAPYLSN